MIGSALFLVACAPEVGPGGAGGRPDPLTPTAIVSTPPLTATTSRCPAGDATCVDLLTVPPLWWIEEPWKVSSIEAVGDVNADGLADAAVHLTDYVAELHHTSLLFGPLTRPARLPSGDDLGFSAFVGGGDLTGDGIPELIDEEGNVLVGPVAAGATFTEAAGVLPTFEEGPYPMRVDVDSDGDLDQVIQSTNHLDIWTGPWTTWATDPPTASLSFACPPIENDPQGGQLTAVPDLDLDGIGELWVAGDWGCTPYRIPANVVGEIDVPATYAPATLNAPIPYGDQDGDGHTDFRWYYRDATAQWVHEVLSPPLAEGPSGWTGTLLGVVPLDSFYGGAPHLLGASVVGDEHADFHDGAYMPDLGLSGGIIVEGGPNGGLLTGDVALKVLGSETGSVDYIGGFVVQEEGVFVRVLDVN